MWSFLGFSELANECAVFSLEIVGGKGGELPGQVNLDVFVSECILHYKQGISENYLMGDNVLPWHMKCFVRVCVLVTEELFQ